ncbi:class I SAM-dependent methyltransferase [Nocardia sp. NPDC051756]|uniref:class I SAM-dependent methyltransferase n=1 Tax=Nocardia sp. NPDC051756 TaxID=3154751 RepID=UPI0034126BB1
MPMGHVVTQLDIWDEWHAERDIYGRGRSQQKLTNMLIEALSPLPGKSILELGCGQGRDAILFAENGAKVYASDISEVAIAKSQKNALSAGVNILFDRHDMSEGQLPEFSISQFDGVFCHLSLHYFTQSVTALLFKEIARSTRSGGFLAFMVKSTKDPSFGLGEQLEDNMFRRKGHVRHFFSTDYTRNLLLSDWEILSFDEPAECYQSTTPSAFIRVVARKS